MAMTKDEVFDKVKDVLVDALGVDDDEVTPDAKLSADLGAESIDYLDIQFRLEKAFGIKIEKDEMLPENVLNDSRYVKDGKVTDDGMIELRKRLPHADLSDFDTHRGVNEFINVFKVDTMVKFVQSKLG